MEEAEDTIGTWEYCIVLYYTGLVVARRAGIPVSPVCPNFSDLFRFSPSLRVFLLSTLHKLTTHHTLSQNSHMHKNIKD